MLALGTRLRPLGRLAYEVLARGYSLYLLRGERGSAAYARTSLGAGDAVYGLSDLDIVAVVEGPAARERVRRRWRRGRRVIGDAFFDWPLILERRDIEEVGPEAPQTYGLSGTDSPALYFGPGADEERVWLAERPELHGPAAGWRRLRGPDLAPGGAAHRPGVDRIAAWLELQSCWRLVFPFCEEPGAHTRPWANYMCVKMYAYPLRAWLWQARRERATTRAEALDWGLRALPAEEEAIRAALALDGDLARRDPPPLAGALAFLVRMSERLADSLAEDAGSAEGTEVRLEWGGVDELYCPRGGWEGEPGPELLPLADWRALACPTLPDEAIAPVSGDPADPELVGGLAGLASHGAAYPALRSGSVLVLPSSARWRSELRSVQCAATDPVSWALADGAAMARFPGLPGLSAADWAQRAVAEHGAGLDGPDPEGEHSGRILGELIAAARAMFFHQSVVEGEPRLALTAAATLRLLAERAYEGVAAEAAAAYEDFAVHWNEPPAGTVAALRSAVSSLYRSERATSASNQRSGTRLAIAQRSFASRPRR